jgi:two-component system, NarL family, sensor histidine kinase DesK
MSRRAGQSATAPGLARLQRGGRRGGAKAGQRAGGTESSRPATGIVVAALFFLFLARASGADSVGGWREVPFIAATFVIPALYAFAGPRLLALRHSWWLLAAQAGLTWVPIVLFGSSWVAGTGGLLAGLVLLSVAAPLSWLVAGGLLAAEVLVRTLVTGLPYAEIGFPYRWSAMAWLIIIYVDDGLLFFGLVRLAQIAGEVRRARGQVADLAVAGERVEAAAHFQSAIGDRLAAVAAVAVTARQALPGDPARARALIAEAGAAARAAAARARALNGARQAAPLPEQAGQAVIGARLAWAILVSALAGFLSIDVLYAIAGHYSARSSAVLFGTVVPAAILQLYQSRPVPGGGRARWWKLALIVQAAVVFAAFLPVIGVYSATMAGFLAGTMLLVLPGWWRWAGFAATAIAWTGLYVAVPERGVTLSERLAPTSAAYLAAAVTATGLLVYGLSWLAGLARRLEDMHRDLARVAVVQERLRVARDMHDLLGLGLATIALKTDLAGRLISRGDARAAAELEEVGRISAAARAEMRQVTGDSQRLSLASEAAAARQLLGWAGIEVDTDLPGGPLPHAADAVLAVVLREAVTNVLRHSAASSCRIRVTAQGGLVQLRVSNDGATSEHPSGPERPAAPVPGVPPVFQPASGDHPGSGLVNLAARLAAAGGRLVSRQADGRFDLVAEIPSRAADLRPGAPVGPASPPSRA